MHSDSFNRLLLLGLGGAAVWLTQCSQLTKIDWSTIPPSSGGVSAAGGEPAAGGADPVGGEAGASGEAGAMAGAGGEAGESEDTGGFGGTTGGTGGALGGSGGTAGKGGGGSAGTAGSGGSAGAGELHATCTAAPNAAPVDPATIANDIVFFDGGPGANGMRGGRTGLDAACVVAKNALKLKQADMDTHAVISVSPADQIFDMPKNYKIPTRAARVVSPLGITIASSWVNSWLNPAPGKPSLVCAGVMPPTVTTWLTGSNKLTQQAPDAPVGEVGQYGQYDSVTAQDGTTTDNACHGWTSGVKGDDQARLGSATVINNDVWFIYWYTVDCDSPNRHILCEAHVPPVTP